MINNIIDGQAADDCVAWKMPIVSTVENSFMKQQKAILQQQENISNQDAHEQAFQKGFNEGLQAGQSAIQQKIEQLESMIKLLEQPLETTDDVLELQILKLTQITAKACLKAELTLDPNKILNVISNLMAQLGSSPRTITLHCSEEDYQTVQLAMSSNNIQINNIRFVSDKDCQRGECILIRDDIILTSSVNATLGSIASELLDEGSELTTTEDSHVPE